MTKSAVIFDVDGVLVASGHAHAASWRALARESGVAFTDEQFRATFGQTSRDIIRSLWGPKPTDARIKQLDDEKEALYRELITGMVPLTIGAREALRALADDGLVLAVATSGPRANLDLVLGETGLAPLFAATVTGDDIEHGKPAPDCFLMAADRIGLPPARCVVVEDAPAGIRAATAAGMPTIGFVGTHLADTLRDEGAARVVQRMADITPPTVRGLVDAA